MQQFIRTGAMRWLSVAVFMCFGMLEGFSQVTTATILGKITDAKGERLVGAAVKATHVPSGTMYGNITREDGTYTLPNMRVGGPYTVVVSFVGYKDQTFENVLLDLAQKLTLDVVLSDASTNLQAVDVTANRFDSRRTGAANNFNREAIQKLPTISRSASDIYRLTPASDGNSFAGRNGQFNNFSLDGTIFNNPFGLDAATPGGQTDAQPVSLDAIEQINVAIAPYDVTQAGFTGAAVNSVTKSGTNEVRGTVFGFYRNQNFTGSKVAGTSIFVPDLNQTQAGFSLGGPIVKNKLFYFVNFELERRSDLGSNFLAARPGLTGGNISRVAATDLDAVSNALRTRFGYETGAYENYFFNTNNQKGIVKLDWNLFDNASSSHKLTFTYNFLDAYKEKPAHPSAIGRRGPDATTLQFQNSGYRINNIIHSGIMELKSTFGQIYANKFVAGFSAFRDSRDPLSTPFPVINIQKDGVRYIVAGHEPFSINNVLGQDVFQIRNDFNVYLKNHTLTIGASFERFNFDNSFNLNAYNGTFSDFPSVQGFLDSIAKPGYAAIVNAARQTGAQAADKWALAETNVGQIAVYAQDEIQLGKNLTLTIGIRVDRPEYFDTKTKIQENIDRNCCYQPNNQYYDQNGTPVKFDHTALPTEKILFSPRMGFNWDAEGNRQTTVRGGTGLFTGRFPFVWVGNQVANPNFFFYCVTDPNFNFPQVWRTNLGIDKKFGDGWQATADLIYTQDINAMMVRNYGLKLPSGTLNGVGDNRPIYRATDRALDGFGGVTNAYVFTNANVGYTFNGTIQIQRTFQNNMFASLAYNYGISKDASSIPAEISSDAYDRNPAYGHVNNAVLANSLYGNLHRIVGNFNKKFTYGNWSTTVSAFMQYVKGGRFSYTYSGDINNDGSFNNDLIYIPTDAQVDQMAFVGTAAEQTAQRAALKAYIAQDDYLSENRGKVSEKYALLSTWYNNWDIRILQDYNFKVGERTNTIQFSLDILNAGNLLNSDWGVRQLPTNTQPIGVSVGNNNVPVYSFDTNLKSTFTNDFSLLSRWQMQFGIRYIF